MTERQPTAGQEEKLVVAVKNNEELQNLLGRFDQHVTLLDSYFNVRVRPEGKNVVVEGSKKEAGQAALLLNELLWLIRQGWTLAVSDVEYAIQLILNGQADKLRSLFTDMVFVTPRGKKIKPKTIAQKAYLDAIRNNDIVFCIGPAGTGKTYIAMTMAVKALKERSVQRLILTRPAVEAGENLGFLPGDLQEKVDPYLHPL